jgi:hypothetical protein
MEQPLGPIENLEDRARALTTVGPAGPHTLLSGYLSTSARRPLSAYTPLGTTRNIMRGVGHSSARDMATRGLALLDAMPSDDYDGNATICRRILNVMRSHPETRPAAELGLKALGVVSNETYDFIRVTRAVLLHFEAATPGELLELALAFFDDLKYAYNLNQLGPMLVREIAPQIADFGFENTLRHTLEHVPWEKAYVVYQGILEDLKSWLEADARMAKASA